MIFDDPVMNGLLVVWGVLSVAFLLPLLPARRRTGPDGVAWDPAKVPPKLVPQEHWPGDARRGLHHVRWLYFFMPATWFAYYCGFEFYRAVSPEGWLGYVAWWRPVLGWAEHFPLVQALREGLPMEVVYHADRVEHMLGVYWITVSIGVVTVIINPKRFIYYIYANIFSMYALDRRKFIKYMCESVGLSIICFVCAYVFAGGWYPEGHPAFESYEVFRESNFRLGITVWAWFGMLLSNFCAIGIVVYPFFSFTAILIFFLSRDRWVRIFGE
ncbi:MAG: hypothetical protein WCZ23_09390 [Rhodospirillaceae bacterium]